MQIFHSSMKSRVQQREPFFTCRTFKDSVIQIASARIMESFIMTPGHLRVSSKSNSKKPTTHRRKGLAKGTTFFLRNYLVQRCLLMPGSQGELCSCKVLPALAIQVYSFPKAPTITEGLPTSNVQPSSSSSSQL